MRKFTQLCMALLAFFGSATAVSAQDYVVSETSETAVPADGLYLLKCKSQNWTGYARYCATYDGQDGQLGIAYFGSSVTVPQPGDAEFTTYLWQLTNNTEDGTFQLVNVSNPDKYFPAEQRNLRFVNTGATGTKADLKAVKIDETSGLTLVDENSWLFYETNYQQSDESDPTLYVHCNDTKSTSKGFSYWNGYGVNSGISSVSQFAFYKVTEASSLSEEELAPARELLAYVGVGYPKADSEARVALQNIVDNPVGKELSELEAAMAAFKVEKDVQLPENGKMYTLSFVTTAGASYYANETDDDMVLESYTDGATYPASAALTAQVNDNGTFSFVTAQGRFLAYHENPANNTSWLTGANLQGFTDAYSEANDFEVARVVKQGAVTVSDEALFGLLTFRGVRGTQNGSNVYGYLNIKVDGPTFDGTSTAYFNSAYTSCIRLQEYVAPPVQNTLEPTEVTPAPGFDTTYEAFPAEVTLTFDAAAAPLTLDESKSVTFLTRNGQAPALSATVAVNEAQVVVTVTGQVEESGAYMMVLPEGLVTAADGSYNPELNYSYAVQLPANTLVYTAVDPENESTVEKLEVITVTFNEEVGAVVSNLLEVRNAADEVVTTATAAFNPDNWSAIDITLSEPITAEGTYTITVPEGGVFNNFYDGDADDLGVSNGATFNPEFTLTYTVGKVVYPLGDGVTLKMQLSNEKVYALHNPIRNGYLVYNPEQSETNIWVANPISGSQFSSSTRIKTLDVTSPNDAWMCVQVDQNFYIYNLGAKKYLTTPEWENKDEVCTAAQFSDEPVHIFCVTRTSDSRAALNTHQDDAHSYLCIDASFIGDNRPATNWTYSDDGSAWEFQENPNLTIDQSVLDQLVTDIKNAIASRPAVKGVYNLSGVKLNAKSAKDLEKGVYIIDGQKVVVK